MRYVFTLIGVMIVLRTFSWLRKDRRLKHKRLKQLPDAGTIGILTVVTGSRELKEGAVIPVPHEGVIGYLRTCDMVVPVEDVAGVHADFSFVDGKGLYILPRRGCEVTIDGVALQSRKDAKRYPMQHGSILEIGQAVLQLGVFAGLDVKETRIEPWYEEPEVGGEAYLPDMPSAPLPYPQQPGAYPGYPPHAPQGQPTQGVPPYVNPPYGQPTYGQPPLNPPYGAYQPNGLNQPNGSGQPDWPWQGGDEDAP